MLIIYTIAATLAALIWFAATVRQTARADRAEAALARVEAVIAEKGRSLRYYTVRDAIHGAGGAK